MSGLDNILSQLVPSSGKTIGVDIGSGYIKVCELKGNTISRFGLSALSEAAIIEDEIQKSEELITKIKNTIKEAGCKGKSVAMSIQGPNTVIKRMQVPEGSDDEVEDHILWESEQYIPFGADDAQISFFIIGTNDGGGKDVILTAARDDTIHAFEKVVIEAGYAPKVVEISSLSLANLFEKCYEDYSNSGQTYALIDFGAQTTKVIIYRSGAPLFCKEIPIGGVLVTEEIQRQMGVSYSEAEDLKINGDASGNLPEEIMGIIDEHSQNLFEDVKKSLNFFISGGSDNTIELCLITGGNSRLPGLEEGLEEVLGIDVEFFDPLRKLKVDSSIGEFEIEQMKYMGNIAAGLSMRVV